MKNLIKKLLIPFRKFVQYLVVPDFPLDYMRISSYKTSLVLWYEIEMMQSSLEYAIKNFRNCLRFYIRSQLWDYAISHILKTDNKEQLHLEFGTWKGESINYFSSRLTKVKFYGFDSFEGLKEDWSGHSLAKGNFDLKGKTPKVNENVTLIKGWFDTSLPLFLEQNDNKIKFLHIDCDTYESTKIVLDLLKGRIISGTFILFDEYIGYPSWNVGEYKAFQELITETNLKYEYIGFSNQAVLVKIL